MHSLAQVLAEALLDEKKNGAPSAIDDEWMSMGDAQRDAFTHRHLLSIWDSIERVTG